MYKQQVDSLIQYLSGKVPCCQYAEITVTSQYGHFTVRHSDDWVISILIQDGIINVIEILVTKIQLVDPQSYPKVAKVIEDILRRKEAAIDAASNMWLPVSATSRYTGNDGRDNRQ